MLVTRRRRSLLRFSCVANDACLWRRRSLRFARHMTASLIASLALRRNRRVSVAPSVPSLRSPHDSVAHCLASPASQTTRACGAVGPFASLVTWQRRSMLRFSCVANDVCLWRRRPPSIRSFHNADAHYIASLVIQTACSLAPLARRFDRHTTASLIAWLLWRRKRRLPMAPSVPQRCS